MEVREVQGGGEGGTGDASVKDDEVESREVGREHKSRTDRWEMK